MENAVVYPRFRFFVGFAFCFYWFTFGVVTVIFAPLLSTVANEFGAQVGSLMMALMSLNAIGIGLGTVATGYLVDKIGSRWVLLLSATMITVYLATVPYISHTVTQIIICRFIEGFCSGPVFSTLAKITRAWFPPKEHGVFNGVANGVMAAGFAGTYLVLVPWLTYFDADWRKMIQSIALLSSVAIVLLAFTFLGKEPKAPQWSFTPEQVEAAKRDFSRALRLPTFWVGAALLTLAMTVMQVINGLTPSYVFLPKPMGLGMHDAWAGPRLAFIQIGMIASGVLLSFLLHKLCRNKPKRVCMIGFVMTGLSCMSLVMPFACNPAWRLSVVFFLMGFFMNINYPSVTVFVAANYPLPILGRAFAVCATVAQFVSAAFSGFSGYMLNVTHTFTAVYGTCLMLCVIAFLLSFFLNPVRAFQKTESAWEQTKVEVGA
jgi:MFS family permease